MATFKPDIQYKRADGTYNIRIRITHNCQIRRVSTNLFATSADMTKSLKLKNQNLIDQINALISQFRTACNELGFSITDMSIDDLVEAIKLRLKGGDKFKLDFIKFANDEIAKMKKGTANLYHPAISSLKRFIKRDSLDISEINKKFLKEFEEFIETEPSQRGSNRKKPVKEQQSKGERAKSAYLTCIRSIFNKARDKYNDDDRGVVLIPFYPFKNFKLQPEPVTRKRALPIETIQSIINLPTKGGRCGLARDCFLLSLGLIGINSADLFSAGPERIGIITYHRSKTKDRRTDNAEFKVQIEPCLLPLIEKYRDTDGKRMFSFYKMYKNAEGFNKAINKGLKQVGDALGIEDLEYYAAHHSWATIASSLAVGIDKATVHDALNHVDPKMKVTDIYIDRDWKVIWEANRKVLALFDWGNVV